MGNDADLKQKLPPGNELEWKREAEAMGVVGVGIWDKEKLKSASKIGYDQYLCLRVLHMEIRRANFRPKNFELDVWIEQAKEKLDNSESWRIYKDNFAQPNSIFHSAFSVATYMQREVLQAKENKDEVSTSVIFTPISKRTRAQELRKQIAQETPSKPPRSGIFGDMARGGLGNINENFKSLNLSSDQEEEGDAYEDEDEDEDEDDQPTPSVYTPFSPLSPEEYEYSNYFYPPTEDEQIVNAALLDFLLPLTIFYDISTQWTIHRKRLIAKFGSSQFEARTDGYLRDKGTKKVRALIEVKAAVRNRNTRPINMQESAAMASWILTDQETTGCVGRYVSRPY